MSVVSLAEVPRALGFVGAPGSRASPPTSFGLWLVGGEPVTSKLKAFSALSQSCWRRAGVSLQSRKQTLQRDEGCCAKVQLRRPELSCVNHLWESERGQAAV